MARYKLMFNNKVIEIYESLDEAMEECGYRNYEYAIETAILGEYDYHRFYVVEDDNI